eukprot:TRINITY_DN5692_c0_g1_i2.p1 TRINITY_DN5692_c0_g1~~TRINITY_DN5692_c0_g1_i2.p1  ORF type:complete len:612 (-),score=100.28 TRINITY_DN5692_c0_g1_i2:95-1930(-)
MPSVMSWEEDVDDGPSMMPMKSDFGDRLMKPPGLTGHTRVILEKDSHLMQHMIEKLNSRTSAAGEKEDQSKVGKWRKRALWVAQLQSYQWAMALMTMVSVGLVVIETDAIAVEQPLTHEHETTNRALLVIFVIDIVLRIYGCGVEFFASVVNALELLLVLADIVFECWNGMPSAFTVGKVVRFLRLGRVVRRFVQLRELYLMCLGILTSLRAVLFGIALVIACVIVFSILAVYFVRPIAHQLDDAGAFGDCDNCRTAFDTVTASGITFMTTIIAGDSWGKVSVPLIVNSRGAGSVILLCFFAIELGLLNTIAAVIVDKQVQARADDEEFTRMIQAEDLTTSFEKMRCLFIELDKDNSESLGLSELNDYYDTHAEFRNLLNRMDVHKDQLPIIFDIIDRNCNGQIDFAEFVAGLHNLVNEDAHTLAVIGKHYSEKCYEMLRHLFEKLEQQTQVLQEAVTENSFKDDEEMVATLQRSMVECSTPQWADITRALESIREDISSKLVPVADGKLTAALDSFTPPCSLKEPGSACATSPVPTSMVAREALRANGFNKVDPGREMPLETPQLWRPVPRYAAGQFQCDSVLGTKYPDELGLVADGQPRLPKRGYLAPG